MLSPIQETILQSSLLARMVVLGNTDNDSLAVLWCGSAVNPDIVNNAIAGNLEPLDVADNSHGTQITLPRTDRSVSLAAAGVAYGQRGTGPLFVALTESGVAYFRARQPA